MTHLVYFAQAQSGLVKIGYCKNLRYRLYSLRHEMRGPVKLLASILGGAEKEETRAAEQQIHKMFASDRVHGEWFKPSPQLLRFIAEPVSFSEAGVS